MLTGAMEDRAGPGARRVLAILSILYAEAPTMLASTDHQNPTFHPTFHLGHLPPLKLGYKLCKGSWPRRLNPQAGSWAQCPHSRTQQEPCHPHRQPGLRPKDTTATFTQPIPRAGYRPCPTTRGQEVSGNTEPGDAGKMVA